ncbi:DNA-cytosine methyltransferase [Hyphomicrobiales bacterium]|nr:DNA-cytosine methyltransferase [Hyphomicrobiales bacterium]CAH1697567.1 DNA-cytosine methyltransferase [Hyphomicrobiales bacterium]CAI0346322.1 DNA-cytosine methyltransferase [Hyphomicrobiales bacterium]
MSPFSQLRQQAGLTIPETAERVGFDERTVYRWENGDTSPRKPVIEILQSLADTRAARAAPGSFTFIDLFAGIGGLRRGFEPIGGRCVFTSEWDRFSQETYRANYVCDHELAGDITKIDAADIPAHDVLLAGFPCQPFSLAGVSKKNSLNRPHGFQCDVQGNLFFDVARIIKHHRPKAFLLENVKNLKSHDKGRTFDIIMKTLQEDLGYTVKTRIIDSRSWVPQHRERIFIVGFREENGFSFDDFVLPPEAQNPTMSQVLHPEDGSEEYDPQFIDARGRVQSRYTLSDHLWGYLQNYAEKHRLKGNGFGFGLVGPGDVSRTLSARYHKDGSEILVRQKRKNPRRLTPRECARLMGFEKPGENEFRIRVSDTQAYRQFGNAVVVPVVEAVARHMAPWLVSEETVAEPKRKKARAVA